MSLMDTSRSQRRKTPLFILFRFIYPSLLALYLFFVSRRTRGGLVPGSPGPIIQHQARRGDAFCCCCVFDQEAMRSERLQPQYPLRDGLESCLYNCFGSNLYKAARATTKGWFSRRDERCQSILALCICIWDRVCALSSGVCLIPGTWYREEDKEWGQEDMSAVMKTNWKGFVSTPSLMDGFI